MKKSHIPVHDRATFRVHDQVARDADDFATKMNEKINKDTMMY